MQRPEARALIATDACKVAKWLPGRHALQIKYAERALGSLAIGGQSSRFCAKALCIASRNSHKAAGERASARHDAVRFADDNSPDFIRVKAYA